MTPNRSRSPGGIVNSLLRRCGRLAGKVPDLLSSRLSCRCCFSERRSFLRGATAWHTSQRENFTRQSPREFSRYRAAQEAAPEEEDFREGRPPCRPIFLIDNRA